MDKCKYYQIIRFDIADDQHSQRINYIVMLHADRPAKDGVFLLQSTQ